MKCTSCGLPLSPARTMTSCPRCGMPIVSEKKSPSSPAHKPFLRTATSPPDRVPWKPVAPQAQLPEVAQSPMARPGAHVQSPVTLPPPSPAESEYMSQPDSMWPPMPTSLGYLSPRQDSNPRRQRQGARELKDAPQAPLRPLRMLIGSAQGKGSRRKNNLGFIVAGLCVITGGLILIFVYFMAIGLPGSSTGTNTAKTNTATNSSPTTASSPASSPTATPFPGQKYIDHAQLASSIDPTSYQAIQFTTTFKANQRIYITFQLHPAGQNGAACLLWYANNKQFFSYPLPVYPNERTTYSYASYSGTGSGHVEIYWASTIKCTDKILAQHVNFTVTA